MDDHHARLLIKAMAYHWENELAKMERRELPYGYNDFIGLLHE